MTADRPLPLLEARIRLLENRLDALEARETRPAGVLSQADRQASALLMRASLKRSRELGVQVDRLLRGM